MAKALLFSDLHLHSHKDSVDRLQDCLRVFEWVFTQATENKCEHIFFLGDLFHERSKIDLLNYVRTTEMIRKYMLDDCPFELWLLVGNHDMYHKERWDVNSIKPLTFYPHIHIIDKPETIEIGGRKIDFCPHTENPPKELEKLKKGRKDLDILLGHMAVHGATLNKLYGTRADVIVEYDNDMVVVKPEIFDPWKKTFLGHYHGAQQLSEKAEYVGSPLQLSFGEAFQKKHLIVLDLDTLEKTYIVNDFSPRHIITEPSDIVSYDLTNNFVRIVLDNLCSKEQSDLRRNILASHKVATLDFKQKEKKDAEELAVVEGAKAILLDQNEMLKKYTRDKGVPSGLDETHLMSWGQKIVAKQV